MDDNDPTWKRQLLPGEWVTDLSAAVEQMLADAGRRYGKRTAMSELCAQLEAEGWERVEAKDQGPEGAARAVLYRKDGKAIVVDAHAAPLTLTRQRPIHARRGKG